MKIKGVYWPEAKCVGSAKVQLKNNCDPKVASFFPSHLVKHAAPKGCTTYKYEATAEQWQSLAAVWAAETTGKDRFRFDDDNGSGETVH